MKKNIRKILLVMFAFIIGCSLVFAKDTGKNKKITTMLQTKNTNSINKNSMSPSIVAVNVNLHNAEIKDGDKVLNTYQVTFDPSEYYNALPNPIKKENLNFAGWYYDEALTKKISIKSIADMNILPVINENGKIEPGNIDIYAKWTGEKSEEKICVPKENITLLDVKYETNGGKEIVNSVVKNDGTGNAKYQDGLPIAKRNGYSFDGWYYDAALTNKVNANELYELNKKKTTDECGNEIDDVNLTLYAKWSEIKNDKCVTTSSGAFYVEYETNGGNMLPKKLIVPNQTKGELPVPTRDNYTFAGWYYESSLTNKTVGGFENIITTATKDGCGNTVYNNVTLYARWYKKVLNYEVTCSSKKTSFKINYSTDGGSVIPSTIYDLAVKSTDKLPVPVKKGYSFQGWYYDADFNELVATNVLSGIDFKKNTLTNDEGCDEVQDMTLYAKWVAIDLPVTRTEEELNGTELIYLPDGNYLVEYLESDSDRVVDIIIKEKNSELADKAVKNSVAFHMTYSLTLNNSDENQINDAVEIPLPLPLNVNDDNNELVVYKVDDDGGKTKVKHVFKDGAAIITTSELGIYVVGEASTNLDTIFTVIALIALVIVAVCINNKLTAKREAQITQ